MKWKGGGGGEMGNNKNPDFFFFFKRGPVLVAFGLSGKHPPWPIPSSQTGVFFYVFSLYKNFFFNSEKHDYMKTKGGKKEQETRFLLKMVRPNFV